MKSLRFFSSGSLVTAIFLMLYLLSCKKDPYEIGLDLLPPSDTLYVSHTDTSSVFAYSELQDSIRTDQTSVCFLGSMVDPVFGRTTASFYTQCLLSSEGINFGAGRGLDSLVLVLYYTGSYGDNTEYQQITVYEISEDLNPDSNYYSNQSLSTYGIALAHKTFLPRPNDSIVIDDEKLAPQLRINLSNNSNYLGNKLLFAPDEVLASNEEFLTFMKGIYIKALPVTSAGSLVSFDLAGSSKLILYYHNADTTQGDSLQFSFPINSSAARFNNFDHHQYLEASPDFKQQVIYHDTTLGGEKLFLQTMGGVKMKIRFPYLKDFAKKEKIAINNAVLTLTNFETDTTLAPPPKLALYRVDSTGSLGIMVDELEGQAYFGRSYNPDSRTYWFRLTRYVQQVIENDTAANYELYIYASDPLTYGLSANRVILAGTDPLIPGYEADRVRLSVVYTILP